MMTMQRATTLLLLLLTGCTSHYQVDDEEPLVFQEVSDGSGPTPTDTIASLPFFFQLQRGKIEEAISELQRRREKDPYLYHSATLQQLGLTLIQQGISSSNPVDVQLSLYGIGLSANEQAQAYIKEALYSKQPELQFAAVQLLTQLHTDEAHKLLEEALSSDYFLIRLEALHALASNKLPCAYPQIEALFVKVDPELRPLFPQLLALDGSYPSVQMLKRLIRDSDRNVRLEAIKSVALMKRDDCLADIKSQMYDLSPAIREAVVQGAGEFQESTTRPFLEKMLAQDDLSALVAAYYLSKDACIESEAKRENPFAIHLLGNMKIGREILIEKMRSSNLQTRLNATVALLERKDRACLENLPMLFIQGHNDLVFEEVESPGRALTYFKATPSAQQNVKESPFFFELSLRLREKWLIESMELPEEDFLAIAEGIFHYEQHELVPLLVRLLENIRSSNAISLLKKESERLGSPFIRTYATLALFRLNEEGPYAKKLIDWIGQNQAHDLIQARPLLPWKLRTEKSPYVITLEERSRLLVEAFEAFAINRKDDSINALLEAIKSGNEHNRYLLAGLLIRAAE